MIRFLIALSACVALLTAGCVALPDASGGRSYSAIVLGDTHFDGPETNTYHSMTSKWSDNRKKEFSRNVGMWKKRMPGLLASAGATARKNSAEFVIQAGDIAQGDCPDYNGHRKIIGDAFDTVKMQFPEIPLLPVMGNHDFRSPNGRKAYIDEMSPRVSRELGETVTVPNYVVRHGPDAYIFLDFSEPDVEFMKKALAENADARYTFVISHGLLIPDSGSDWFMLGRGTKPETRFEMLELFATNKVIAVSGHVHRTELVDYAKEGGQITQLVISSVRTDGSRDSIEPSFGDKPEDYGMKKYADGKWPAILRPYQPYITRYFSTRSAGYMLLRVSDEGVVAEYYPGESRKCGKTFTLR